MASARQLPPGPKMPPLLVTVWWLLRPIALLEWCRRRYGDAFSLMFMGFGAPMVLLSDPEAIRELYSSKEHTLPPGRTLTLLPIMGAGSLLLLEGAEHLERRRLTLPAFHGERLRTYEAGVREIAEREVARWRAGERFAIRERMLGVTLESILRVVFGVSREERLARLRGVIPQVMSDSSSLRLSLHVLAAQRFGWQNPLETLASRRRELDEVLFAEIAERRQSDERGADVVSLLLDARFEDGSAMNDREVRDHLVTLLFAGHETTATGLAWTFELLLRNPRVLERLVAAVGEGDELYPRAVVSEALRLRPVVPLAGRKLQSDLVAGGLELAAGTDVTPAIWLVHTHPGVYREPYEFRPERFLEASPTTYAWIPFGGGVRRCIGAAFAEQEMRIVLETVLSRVELAADGRPERVARRNVTFVPRHGTRVRVARLLRVSRTPVPSTV